jgi:hypothetical protein
MPNPIVDDTQRPVQRPASNLQAASQQRKQTIQGQPLQPAQPTKIVIKGQTKGILTGGRPVGLGVPPVGYDTRPPQEGPQNIPNYDKLSGLERSVMSILPGIPKPLTDTLEWFNGTWAGQALNFLDIGAETLERGTGFVTQALAAYGNDETWNDFNKDLKAAWYAGSLSADLSQSSIEIADPATWQPHKGVPFIRFVNDNLDMPGVEGTIRVRQSIASQVAQGVDYKTALENARGAEFENLGALALRAQLQDLFFHVAADPINIIMPFLAPIEALQALRKGLLATKIGTTAGIAVDIASAEGKLVDANRVLQEVSALGDAAKIESAAADVAKAEETLAGVQETMKLADVSQLNPAERFLLWATGGADSIKTPTKLESTLAKFNPFALTPQARAQEFVDIVLENINSRVIAGNILRNGDYNLDEIARVIDRAAAGVSAPEMGHIVATIEGQHVKSVLKQVSVEVGNMARAYNATGRFERPLIDLIATALGDTPKNIMNRIGAGEAQAIYTQLTRRTLDNPATAASLNDLLARNGLVSQQFTPQLLETSLNVFKGNDLYNSGMVVAEMMNKIGDAAAHQGILRFGVTQRGFIQSLSDATKQAQTLAFLKLNPTYPVRNFLNNVVTMQARGALGFLTPQMFEDLWKVRGFKPVRLSEGVGIGGDVERLIAKGEVAGKATTTANQIISDVVKGDKGWISRFEKAIQALPEKVGIKKDFGTMSADIERFASENAMSTFYLRGEAMYSKVGGQFIPKMADFDPALAKALGPEMSKAFENAIRDAKLNPARLDAIMGEGASLGKSTATVFDNVEAKLGKPLNAVVGDEFVASIEDGLKAAVETGSPAKVNQYIDDVASKLDDHITRMNDEALDVMTEEAISRVKTEGPGAFARVWGDAVDEWYGGIIRHDTDVAKTAELIRQGVDPKLAGAQWERLALQGDNYWSRQWKRLESRMTGLAKGAEEVGLKVQADLVQTNFKNWRGTWQTFFDNRKKLYGEFFEALNKGETPRLGWDEITGRLDMEYQKAVKVETLSTRAIDDLVANALPNEVKPLYKAWREKVIELRLADKAEVERFRQYIKTIPYDQIQPAYNLHWQNRIKLTQEAWKVERQGLAALSGNKDAQALYAESATAIAQADAVQNVERSQAALANLPPALAGAKPRYGYKGNNFELAFDSDIDKALYTVANPNTSSKRETEFLAWLGEVFPDNTTAEIRAMGQSVRKEIKGLAQGAEEGTTVLRIPEGSTPRTATLGEAPTKQFVVDSTPLFKPEQFAGTGLDQLIYTKGQEALDLVRDEALKLIDQPKVATNTIDPALMPQLKQYLAKVKGGMGDARYAATRFAEYGRDSALLNYNRRFNYNSWLGMVMPYEFWATTSMWKWALHSIDRPAMLSSYLRVKKFLETAYRPEEGLPSRLRGTLRIPIPFMPDWMGGEGFIDPLKTFLPFDSWAQPFEQADQQMLSDEGKALRKLEELYNDGKITQSEYTQAFNEKKGTSWERALVLAQQDDTEQRQDGWDFATMFTSPHAPLQWAADAIRGRETGAVLPLTNTIGSVLGAFGLDPAGPLNPEAAIRKSLGYHPFNKWDDYYVDRMLVNMAADGVISSTDAKTAMIQRTGDAFEEARIRVGMERSGGPAGVLIGLAGFPVHTYPEGEETVRKEQDEYAAAWAEYDRLVSDPTFEGNAYKTVFDPFYDKYPEYEARVALFAKPEERLNRFLQDSVWDKYYSLTRVEQEFLKESLPDFARDFVDKDTRLETQSVEKMALWLKLMGGDPVGGLDPKDANTVPLNFPDKTTANIAQGFYDGRDRMFPQWYELSQQYFEVPDGRQYVAPPAVNAYVQERDKLFGQEIFDIQNQYYALKDAGDKAGAKAYLNANPELKQYWDWKNANQTEEVKAYLAGDGAITKSNKSIWLDQHPQYKVYLNWRNDYLKRNPQIVPYVTDTDKRPNWYSDEMAAPGLPDLTWDEWRGNLGWTLSNIVLETQYGEPLPDVARTQLQKVADGYGWTGSLDEFADYITENAP